MHSYFLLTSDNPKSGYICFLLILILFMSFLVVFNLEKIKYFFKSVRKLCNEIKTTKIQYSSNKEKFLYNILFYICALAIHFTIGISYFETLINNLQSQIHFKNEFVFISYAFSLISYILWNIQSIYFRNTSNNKSLFKKIMIILLGDTILLGLNLCFYVSLYRYKLYTPYIIATITASVIFVFISIFASYVIYYLLMTISVFFNRYINSIEPSLKTNYVGTIIITQMLLIFLFVVLIFCYPYAFYKYSIGISLIICYFTYMSLIIEMIKDPFGFIKKRRRKSKKHFTNIKKSKNVVRCSIIVICTIIYNLYLMVLWSQKFIESIPFDGIINTCKAILRNFYNTVTCFITFNDEGISSTKPITECIILLIYITNVICLVILVSIVIDALSNARHQPKLINPNKKLMNFIKSKKPEPPKVPKSPKFKNNKFTKPSPNIEFPSPKEKGEEKPTEKTINNPPLEEEVVENIAENTIEIPSPEEKNEEKSSQTSYRYFRFKRENRRKAKRKRYRYFLSRKNQRKAKQKSFRTFLFWK